MEINYIEDINKRLLCKDEIEEEEFLALYNGIIKNYLTNKENKNIKITEDNQEEQFEKVMKSLPKYSQYFNIESHEECLNDYLKNIPQEMKMGKGDYKGQLNRLINKAVFLQAGLGQFSKNSGVNLDNDKTNYTNSIEDFETASQKLTPQFIEQMASRLGDDNQQAVKIYIDKAKMLCANMAEEAIKDKTTYYARLADYIVDFYADNEIARQQEERVM